MDFQSEFVQTVEGKMLELQNTSEAGARKKLLYNGRSVHNSHIERLWRDEFQGRCHWTHEGIQVWAVQGTLAEEPFRTAPVKNTMTSCKLILLLSKVATKSSACMKINFLLYILACQVHSLHLLITEYTYFMYRCPRAF